MRSKDKTKHVPRELRSLQSHNREKEDEGIGAAIEEEDYEKASELRDEIKKRNQN